jgi:hypothetical protein
MNKKSENLSLMNISNQKMIHIVFLFGVLSICSINLTAQNKSPEQKYLRSGKLLGSKLLTDQKTLKVSNISPHEKFYPVVKSNPVCILVNIELDPGRSISVYDYILKDKNKQSIPCVAISKDGKDFNRATWEIKGTKNSQKLALLFMVSSKDIGFKPEYSLHFKLLGNNTKGVPLSLELPVVKKDPPKTSPPKVTPKDPPKTTPGVWGRNLAEVVKKVPEAKDFQVVYAMNLAKVGRPAKYNTDKSNKLKNIKFTRIAYMLELTKKDNTNQWIFVAVPAFTNDIGQIGIPKVGTKFQQKLQNIFVKTNVKNVPSGSNLQGNIEFWPSNYQPKNDKKVAGADDKKFDTGDGGAGTNAGHGSMQIHVNKPKPTTLFAINNWSKGGNDCSIGIGNNPKQGGRNNPDWTFADNGKDYNSKKLYILVK